MAVLAKCSGRNLTLWLDWYQSPYVFIEGFEQEEGEQGEGRVGRQARQGQPVEAGDC